jgi:hypothetical protein
MGKQVVNNLDMKRIVIVLFLLFSATCFAQVPVIKHVITHKQATIVCNPATGTKSFANWGVFPAGNIPVRKIMMNVTLGSPDSLLTTAHWDYLDHIILRRQGGLNGKAVDYEIGRMLTPYGSIYSKGWNWKWQVDVTDFSPLLRDSVEIDYVHSGYEATTVGWALTIDFEIVEGPPVVVPLGITPLWNKGYKYGDPNNKIEDNLLPVSYESKPGTGISRIRIQHTGHGMDQPKGCSEFCSRWRDLKLDGNLVDHRDMWKDCGSNPLYPQGGTWIFDRAYWCPGDLQVPDVIDVKTKPGKHQVALQMEPYVATDNIQANEDISSYLFQYSLPVKKVDVAVDRIMVPTDEQQFARLNPASFNPRFVIRNLGSENLRSVNISYGTEGFSKKVYQWKGNLAFNQTADIVLPGEIEMNPGQNKFTVSLSKPNGQIDGWMGDNQVTSTFVSPEIFPTDFVVEFLTNNQPKDNKVMLMNNKADTVFYKRPGQLEPKKIYRDTLHLKEGKYEMFLADSAGNGLEFWFQPQQGDGHLQMFDLKGNLIHAFESGCGNGEKFSFTASSKFITDTTKPIYAFSLYPRLTADKTELNVISNKPGNLMVLIMVDGVVWQKHEYTGVRNGTFNYSLENMPAGRIILEVFMDGVSRFKARLNKRGL